ncbi:hypothetical protein HDU76_003068, partial [Blyttiomyces sp. JEL0837]
AEVAPFESEVAHENVTTSFLKRIIPPSTKRDESPLDYFSLRSADTERSDPDPLADALRDDESVPFPRSIPIPNNQIKDPATYHSNTSKLNPENGFIASVMSSPSISPVIHPMVMSPILSERKGKRKMSFDERFEPYKRRLPSSPVNSYDRYMHLSLSPMPSPAVLPASAISSPGGLSSGNNNNNGNGIGIGATGALISNTNGTASSSTSSLNSMMQGQGQGGNNGGGGINATVQTSQGVMFPAPLAPASSSSIPLGGQSWFSGAGAFMASRRRSLSGSSVSSISSMWGLPPQAAPGVTGVGGIVGGGGGSGGSGSGSGSDAVMLTSGGESSSAGATGVSIVSQAALIGAALGRPNSPRIGLGMASPLHVPSSPGKQVLGQMLNITGAQSDLSKMSLG